MDSQKYDFYKTMMQENLNHARHVENERMSLAAGMIVMVGAVTAVFFSTIEKIFDEREYVFELPFLICTAILTVTAIAVLAVAKGLNDRWSEVFEEHWQKAECCYKTSGEKSCAVYIGTEEVEVTVEECLFPFQYCFGDEYLDGEKIRRLTAKRFHDLYRLMIVLMIVLAIALFCCLRAVL